MPDGLLIIALQTSRVMYDIVLRDMQNWKDRERWDSPVAKWRRRVRVSCSPGLMVFKPPLINAIGVLSCSISFRMNLNVS